MAFSFQEILEEFVECSYLADRISVEAKYHQLYLKRLQWKREAWLRMRNDPARWSRYLAYHAEYMKQPTQRSKTNAYMKEYRLRPAVLGARRLQRKEYRARNKERLAAKDRLWRESNRERHNANKRASRARLRAANGI